ncbi:HAD family phosphatase [Agreia sp. COWG]|uniref:HAD family hydrolase n=1 Tax=Agreia sp. COWG TaxID=2773266 RepID=UPI0019295F58|nr:HAD-IB family hydrolase [Agreia sp. COWG]CAD5990600.1 Phosphoserine phosphatase [Agreia sp. COWG]
MATIEPPSDSTVDPAAVNTPVIAFFDVDNTLLRGASIWHVAIGAWRRGMLSPRDIWRFFWQQRTFIKVGENMGHLSDIKEKALRLIEGKTQAEIRSLSEDIFDRRIKQRLWPETVALTKEHLAQGHQVWIVSATASEVADVFAHRLGLTGALGTRFESRDGVYTGALEGPVMHAQDKADASIALASKLKADPAECWAYSDSSNDIPLLTFVGHPVVVNPDHGLHAHATKHDWPVMRLNPSSIKEARKRVRRESRRAR